MSQLAGGCHTVLIRQHSAAENGPYTLNHNLTLSENPYGWDVNSNVIYVDQPINTGYSYSEVSLIVPCKDVQKDCIMAHSSMHTLRPRLFICVSQVLAGWWRCCLLYMHMLCMHIYVRLSTLFWASLTPHVPKILPVSFVLPLPGPP